MSRVDLKYFEAQHREIGWRRGFGAYAISACHWDDSKTAKNKTPKQAWAFCFPYNHPIRAGRIYCAAAPLVFESEPLSPDRTAPTTTTPAITAHSGRAEDEVLSSTTTGTGSTIGSTMPPAKAAEDARTMEEASAKEVIFFIRNTPIGWMISVNIQRAMLKEKSKASTISHLSAQPRHIRHPATPIAAICLQNQQNRTNIGFESSQYQPCRPRRWHFQRRHPAQPCK